MTQILFPGDSYDTPSTPVGPLASLLPTATFFLRLLGIIRRSSLLARQQRYSGEDWAQSSLDTLRALEACGVQAHVRGMDVMNTLSGPCVFIANHMSTLETFVLPCFIQPRLNATFVVKQSLTTYPWFGAVLRARDPISVTRVNPRQDLVTVLEGGEERLRKGTSIIVFPQSTRSRAFNPEQFNSIGVKLARRAQVPIIPIALRTDAWGKNPLFKDIPSIRPEIPVNFRFGEPLMAEGNGKAEHAAICDFIAGNLREWNLPVVV